MSKHSHSPGSVPIEALAQEAQQNILAQGEEAELQHLNQETSRERHSRVAVAALYGGGLATAAWAGLSGTLSGLRFEKTMPFWEAGQHAVNEVQDVLAVTGGVGLAASAATIAGVKLAALRNVRAEAVDKASSREMSEDRLRARRSPVRRGLEAAFAGRVPAMAAVGAGLAVFASTISTEVSDGPERPIEKAMSTIVPGDSMIVNYDGTMPMVESTITRQLANTVLQDAARRGIHGFIFDQNLGQMTKGNQTLSDLSLGVSTPENSPISFAISDGCNSIPIMIDKTAGVNVGETVALNGVKAEVVQEISGISATNRVGIVMDEKAMALCLKKDAEAPVHSVVLDTSPEVAKQILQTANNGEVATVITKEHYLANSKSFWDSNVKPITSVLALFAGLFAAAVSGARVRESLVRNRREWASKLGNHNGEWNIRLTESLRVMKDGVLASIVGGTAAMFATPVAVNSLESGFQATVGIKELLVGASVAIGGSLLGAVKSLIRPSKIIREEESIRA